MPTAHAAEMPSRLVAVHPAVAEAATVQQPGRLLPAECDGSVAICCILAGGNLGGAVTHARLARFASAKLGGLNPRPLRETRPTNPAGENLAGAASSPGRRRLSSWRRILRPAWSIRSAGMPVYTGFSLSLSMSV